ncbi:fatty acid binding protein [Holotrichia oblita]|uniref:Fatty acid binding protein n=2 Tax=Holotrichia oblita TaxID=644536 RepID=A0ACB9SSQ0_HOLOL|nr:fatty acid binding protein [Holotrichia oblita]KAI4457515.1 fatty acid binding protein [Holotrichia oblita]
MVQFNGKYQLERNENFIEFIKSLGQEIPPEMLEKLNKTKSIFEVSVNGDDVKFISHSSSGSTHATSFTFGKQFTEETLAGIKLQTTPKKDGDKIVLTANFGPKSGDRIYEFSDDGLVVSFSAGGVVGKRIYKRL